jgi:hypothetical protein
VERSLLAWVFHSPRRLLLVILIPLVVAVLVPVLWPRLTSTDASSESANPASESSPQATPPVLPEAVPSATAPAEAFQTVDTFVRIWLSGPAAQTDEEVRAWRERLQPYVTPELAAALQDTDPGRIPDATVAGEPRLLRVGEYLTEMSVPMSDGRDLNLTLAWDGRVWRVSDIDRAGET